MKKYTVFGETKVRVSCVISMRDDENITPEKLFKKANRKFGGITFRNLDSEQMKRVGVEGDTESISPMREPIKWYDYHEEDSENVG